MSDDNSGVRWGALGKTILAGAAIAAGVMLVTPAGAAMLTSMGAAGGSLAASSPSLAAAATATAEFMSSGIGWLVTKLVGAAVLYKGAQALGDSDKEGPDLNARQKEAEMSFAAREDMRKMQAVMVARMKANGYQPAMAAANDRGR